MARSIQTQHTFKHWVGRVWMLCCVFAPGLCDPKTHTLKRQHMAVRVCRTLRQTLMCAYGLNKPKIILVERT